MGYRFIGLLLLIQLLFFGCGGPEFPIHKYSQADISKVEYIVQNYGGANNLKDGYGAVHQIVKSGNIKLVEIFHLKERGDLTLRDRHNNRPLHIATEKGFRSIVSYLLLNGANPDRTNESEQTPLHIASESGFTDIVSSLLKYKANPNIADSDGRTPLHISSKKGYLDITKLLIQYQANPNIETKYGWTPLHFASKEGYLQTAKALLNIPKVNINSQTDSGETPLHTALNSKNTDIANYLIRSRSLVNVGDDFKNTPLMLSAKYGYFDILKDVVSKGGEINERNKNGQNALHFALENGHLEIAKYLIDRGIELSRKDNFGKTPLHICAEKGFNLIALALVKKGADVNAENKIDRTPLHIASELGYLNIVKMLLIKGSKINAEDDFDNTPLHLASKSGKVDVVKYLIENKADIEAKDKQYRTPLHISAMNGTIEVAFELIKAGAEIRARETDEKHPLDLAKDRETEVFFKMQEAMLDSKATDIIKLVKGGANPNIQDRYGNTTLHYLASTGHLASVKFLVEQGADRGIKNFSKIKPISIAMKKGHIEVFNYLNGANTHVDKTSPKIEFALKVGGVQRALKKVGQKSTPEDDKRVYNSKKVLIEGKIFDESKISMAQIGGKSIMLSPEGDFSEEVELELGENIFKIYSKDRFGNSAEERVVLFVDEFKGSSIDQSLNWYKKQYALVVGINKYQNSKIPTLNNAVNDAKSVSKMFRDMGFEVIALYDKDATKSNIIEQFKKLITKTKESDSFVFYFAGHGQGVELYGTREGYILPYDSAIDLNSENVVDYDESTISLGSIEKYSRGMQSKHIALLLDSCFSGLAMTKREIKSNKKIDSAYYNDLLDRKAINILTAGDDQPVEDGVGHSPFTTALIEGIKNRGVDVGDNDGYATFTQLATYVKEKVEKKTTRRQRPQFKNLSEKDGDFVFKLK